MESDTRTLFAGGAWLTSSPMSTINDGHTRGGRTTSTWRTATGTTVGCRATGCGATGRGATGCTSAGCGASSPAVVDIRATILLRAIVSTLKT